MDGAGPRGRGRAAAQSGRDTPLAGGMLRARQRQPRAEHPGPWKPRRPLSVTAGFLSPSNPLFFLLSLPVAPLLHFSVFYLSGEMAAIALPLLSTSPFISDFDAFSPKGTCCFSQEQSAVKTRLIKEMSLHIFLMV